MGFFLKLAPAIIRERLLKAAVKRALLQMEQGNFARAERILIKAVME